MTETSDAFATARDQLTAWKTNDFIAYCCAWVKAALWGPTMFTCDIVPIDDAIVAPSIPGSAAHALCAASVFAPVMVGSDMTGWAHMEQRSRKASRNGAKVKCYRLASRATATEYLRRHGEAVQGRMVQVELRVEKT